MLEIMDDLHILKHFSFLISQEKSRRAKRSRSVFTNPVTESAAFGFEGVGTVGVRALAFSATMS